MLCSGFLFIFLMSKSFNNIFFKLTKGQVFQNTSGWSWLWKLSYSSPFLPLSEQYLCISLLKKKYLKAIGWIFAYKISFNSCAQIYCWINTLIEWSDDQLYLFEISWGCLLSLLLGSNFSPHTLTKYVSLPKESSSSSSQASCKMFNLSISSQLLVIS